MIRRPPRSTLFPSPPLFRSAAAEGDAAPAAKAADGAKGAAEGAAKEDGAEGDAKAKAKKSKRKVDVQAPCTSDRKSTRLNSSHLVISYAVFCLKKKKKRPMK